MASQNDFDAVVRVSLAAYESLRQEIGRRSTFQHAFVIFNITAVGALGAFALGTPGRMQHLTVLSVLCPTLGLLWLDHAHGIAKVSAAITQHVQPPLAAAGRALSHESATAEMVWRSGLSKVLLGPPVASLFAVPALLALWLTRQNRSAAWVTGAVLTVAFLLHWCIWLLGYYFGGPQLQYVRPGFRATRRKET